MPIHACPTLRRVPTQGMHFTLEIDFNPSGDSSCVSNTTERERILLLFEIPCHLYIDYYELEAKGIGFMQFCAELFDFDPESISSHGVDCMRRFGLVLIASAASDVVSDNLTSIGLDMDKVPNLISFPVHTRYLSAHYYDDIKISFPIPKVFIISDQFQHSREQNSVSCNDIVSTSLVCTKERRFDTSSLQPISYCIEPILCPHSIVHRNTPIVTTPVGHLCDMRFVGSIELVLPIIAATIILFLLHRRLN